MTHELPDVQAVFRKGRGTRGQIANIRWIIEKARQFQKNFYFCFIDYAKAFDYVDHNKLENSSRDEKNLSCLLRNLFKIGKGVHQGYILSPCLFNLYA